AAALMIALSALGTWGLIRSFARPGQNSMTTIAITVGLASALLTIFVAMFTTASSVRRLHDLNMRGWWIVLFPFGVFSLISMFTLLYLANPQVLAAMLFNPFGLFITVQGLGCLILLVWLLLRRGSNLDNAYGAPINPPRRGG